MPVAIGRTVASLEGMKVLREVRRCLTEEWQESGALVKASYVVLRSITFAFVLVVPSGIDAESKKENSAQQKEVISMDGSTEIGRAHV